MRGRFLHYRHLGTPERSIVSSLFSYGEKDYYLGGHPIWELFRVAYRVSKKPFVVGGLALGLGYSWAFLSRAPRPVSERIYGFPPQRADDQDSEPSFKSLLTIQTRRQLHRGAKLNDGMCGICGQYNFEGLQPVRPRER